MIFKKSTLKSGIKLITVPIKGTKTVTVLVAVHAGSAYEKKSVNGISHFLEHMMFKGTPRRPNTLAIAEELDSIGGEYNAFTGKEWTGYYAKADYRQMSLILDIISDMYLNSKFDPEEMEREKSVILEEMNMYLDTPARYVDDLAEELLYGDQPQGWKIIGEPETVKSVSQRKMRDYYRQQYIAKNTVVVIAGNLGRKNISREVSRYFKSIKKQGVKAAELKIVEKQSKPKLRLHYKKTDQSHLVINLRAYHVHHKNLPALKLLNIILGGNMSSRLFINIREREGLCYYISSHVETNAKCGYLGIKAGVDNKRVQKAISLILKELCKIRDDGVTTAEFKNAKNYVRGKLAVSLETSSDLAFWVGTQEMVKGSIKTPQDILKMIEQVTFAQIKKVATDVIQNKGLNLVVIGPFKKLNQFEKILHI